MKIFTRSYLKSITAETVVVTTTTDATLRGILVGIYADALVLRNVTYLNNADSVPFDGEVAVPREKVAFIQKTGAAS